MAKLVIIGAGVMGSALSVPAAVGNSVTLIGSPLDDHIVSEISNSGRHPGLNVALPEDIEVSRASDDNHSAIESADVIVVGVSSPGVDWALEELQRNKANPDILALVTKGLVSGDGSDQPPQTYAQYIDAELTSPQGRVVGIGGPCIARELALSYPTRVSFASHSLAAANNLRELLQTDYYRVTTRADFTALEACAALKNFMCIGVSAMFTVYEMEEGHAKNPLAALFNQAVHEIDLLSQWIVSGSPERAVVDRDLSAPQRASAFDLAGMGDLHVTVGGGRNSLLGKYLGNGRRLLEVQDSDMKGITVEGVDTGRQLLKGFHAACESGVLDAAELPLTAAILATIDQDLPFEFDFRLLPG